MSTSLQGKGLWAYSHEDLQEFKQRLDHAFWLAPQMDVTHILFKVGQGSSYYADRAATAAQRIREAGLTPFAWMWIPLQDPEWEARVVKRAFDEGYQGLVFNMEESQDPTASSAGRYQEATELGQHLSLLGVNPNDLYLCSFPNIYDHRGGPPYQDPKRLPYDQMAEFCRGGLMPMAYGTFLQTAHTVLDDWAYAHHERWWRERDDWLPIYPILGPYFDEQGTDLMSPQQFAPWLEILDQHDPSFFSIYAARAVNPAIAAMVKDFELSEEDPQPRKKFDVIVHSPVMRFLRLREGPTTDSEELARIPHETRVHSLEGEATQDKVGIPGRWLHVETPDGQRGYMACWYLRETAPPVAIDDRQPVDDAPLPFGQSAWIYGMHAASVNEVSAYGNDIRGLFQPSGNRGWILFTEGIGRRPQDLQPDENRRNRFWDWARHAGYGVMVRLNYGYHDLGTIPEAIHYPAFAETCARYADLYLRHPELAPGVYKWVIIIGNEQNNAREWPRQGHPPEVLTPQRYAHCFNLAYQAIKGVLGKAAMVVPGAVDPYNAALQRPIDYFTQMLEGIDDLDGIALHTYTHGHDVKRITHEKTFDNDPIKDHYYDFQSYRLFMKHIPAHLRDLPVFITETNPLFKSAEGDWGWYDQDIGWITAAYEEIHRWNATPHAQQIRALMLYRFAGDDWTMKDKHTLFQDFKKVLGRDYRWRV
jgi:hypothetical protein